MKNFRHVAELGSERRTVYGSLLDDSSIRESFLRSIGDESIGSFGLRQVLDDVAEIRQYGYEPTRFTPGRQLDSGDPFYTEWYGPDYDNPVDEATIAIDARATESDVWLRFNTGDNNRFGPFFSDSRQFQTLVRTDRIETLDDVRRYLDLPESKTQVVEFEVESGTPVRISQTGETFGGQGGIRQFEVRTDSMLKDTGELGPGDYPGDFRDNNPITEVFDINS